jgi:hypothetical protein
MAASQRLDDYACAIAQALLRSQDQLLALRQQARELGLNEDQYIADHVWKIAQLMESRRP